MNYVGDLKKIFLIVNDVMLHFLLLGENIIVVSLSNYLNSSFSFFSLGHCGKFRDNFNEYIIYFSFKGKVLCKDCTNKTVHTGPNNRPSRVCEVCYTLLVKNSQPYFLTGVPKV